MILVKRLRRLAGEYHGERQRQRFTQLLARRSGIGHADDAVEHSGSVRTPIQESELSNAHGANHDEIQSSF